MPANGFDSSEAGLHGRFLCSMVRAPRMPLVLEETLYAIFKPVWLPSLGLRAVVRGGAGAGPQVHADTPNHSQACSSTAAPAQDILV
jgi:hypothetical protein